MTKYFQERAAKAGRAGVKSRFEGKTKEEISEIMRQVALAKNKKVEDKD